MLEHQQPGGTKNVHRKTARIVNALRPDRSGCLYIAKKTIRIFVVLSHTVMNGQIDLANVGNFCIIDLEATCTPNDATDFVIPREEMETIEIGAVMVDCVSLAVVGEFSTFVRPVRHPVLTEFCTELTTIPQEAVDNAPLFPQAAAELTRWMMSFKRFVFCSWGDYDRTQLARDSAFHGIQGPFGYDPRHINIKRLFSHTQHMPRFHSMARALELAGLPLDGTLHRGIDDARNMARLMPFVLGLRMV